MATRLAELTGAPSTQWDHVILVSGGHNGYADHGRQAASR